MSSWIGTAKVRVVGVKDAAGNTIDGGVADTAVARATSSANNPTIKSTSAVVNADDSKVTITFETDQDLEVIDKTDFNAIVTNATGAVAIKDANAATGETQYTPDSAIKVGKKVTLTWTAPAAVAALKAAASNITFPANAVYNGTENGEGADLTIGTSAVKVADQVAPEFVKFEVTASDKIKVDFNEPLKNIPALYADDFVVIVNGAVVPSSKVTATLDNSDKSVVLTLTGVASLNGATVQVKFKDTVDLADVAGNAFVPTDDHLAGDAPADAVAPTLDSAELTADVKSSAVVDFGTDAGDKDAFTIEATGVGTAGDGIVVEFKNDAAGSTTTATYSSGKVTVELGDDGTGTPGAITATTEDVVDAINALTGAAKVVTATLVGDGSALAALIDNATTAGGENAKLTLTFSEAIDTATLANAGDITIEDRTGNARSLGTSAQFNWSSANTVLTITLGNNTDVVAGDVVTASNAEDVAGNEIDLSTPVTIH